ncbi:hypothetical protein Tco_1194654 [Tanacetum coccineum]
MLNRHKNWLVHKQTTYGKDFLNLFMVDNLPKNVGFLTHLASLVKSWLVQDQTVLGKDYSNLLIADSLLKTIWFINAPCYGNEALASPKANELTIPEQTATGKGTSNPFMAVIMDYLVNISKRRAFWSLNKDILKITILKTNTSYPSRKIRRIRACTHQIPQRIEAQYATEKKKSLVSATPLSTTFFSTSIVRDFQESPDDEEDTRSSQEYMDDLEEEYQARAL